jgi:hypothetical protein
MVRYVSRKGSQSQIAESVAKFHFRQTKISKISITQRYKSLPNIFNSLPRPPDFPRHMNGTWRQQATVF